MKTARQLNFILAAAKLVFVTCNNDGSVNRSGADTTVTGSTRETGEEDFVTDIADDNNARLILLLNAGVSKGMDQEVKSTVQKMLPDHKYLNNELREYAQKNNIVLPDPDTSNAVTIREKAGVEWMKNGLMK